MCHFPSYSRSTVVLVLLVSAQWWPPPSESAAPPPHTRLHGNKHHYETHLPIKLITIILARISYTNRTDACILRIVKYTVFIQYC